MLNKQLNRVWDKGQGVMVSAITTAYNEEKSIAQVIKRTKPFVDEIIVIEDGSSDNTYLIAQQCGAKIIKNSKNLGQLQSLKKGFSKAAGDIIVNLDADLEHNAEEIPKLITPILGDRADLVLGRRKIIPHPSERSIDFLLKFKTGKFYDSGTGFRALKKDLALRLKLEGICACGILVLEAPKLRSRIVQVPDVAPVYTGHS